MEGSLIFPQMKHRSLPDRLPAKPVKQHWRCSCAALSSGFRSMESLSTVPSLDRPRRWMGSSFKKRLILITAINGVEMLISCAVTCLSVPLTLCFYKGRKTG